MPYKNPEDARAARARYRATKPASRKTYEAANGSRLKREQYRRRRIDTPFAGVDGEGGDLPVEGALFGTSHEYLLLRAGDQVLKNPDGAPLRAEQCLAFLADLPKDRIYISYFFDYDVTMMLRRLPKERLKRLFQKLNIFEGVQWNGFEFRYLPHKEFAVRRCGAVYDPAKNPYTVVNDLGTFFQQSFAKTIEDWDAGTEQQRADIARTKGRRADFGQLTQETQEYNELECRLLEEVAEKFREVCADVDCLPPKWQGPGQLASALLRREGVPRKDEIGAFRNEKLWEAGIAAYYGGRFEAFLMGPVPGPVYEYDINSAYPFAMTKLPCLKCGTWSVSKTIPEEGLWFAEVEFSHPGETPVCHLPVRTAAGGLVFPRRGSGTYWSVELQAAGRAGTRYGPIGSVFAYRPGPVCSCRPFHFVAPLYEERKRLGGLRGKVLKLALNSLYGKLAQSVGEPPYANPVWASLITAHTRAMLVDAYRGHEENLVMAATDAVYSRVPLDLPCGPGLGQWEETLHTEGLFVVQPGVYYSGGDHRAKTRGIDHKLFVGAREDFERCFDLLKLGVGETVAIKGRSFLGIRQALAWNRLHQAGQWLETEKKVAIDTRTKRAPRVAVVREGFLRTFPQEGGAASVPYSRAIGGTYRAAREETAEQPDWGDWFSAV